jgi:hypothetical protein
MLKNIVFLLSIVLFAACGNTPKSKTEIIEESKWEAVMANHDVVMPMMSNTNKLRKGLKKVISANPELPEDIKNKITDLIGQLDKADEGMMDWMHGFLPLRKLRKNKNHEEIIKYLDAEDAKIKKVGIDMTNSIKNATDFLKQRAQ